VLATGKVYHVTARSLYASIRCCTANLEALNFGLCGRVNRPVGLTRSVFVVQLTTCRDAKTLASGQGLKLRPVLQVFLFLPGEWCMVHP
jgi:hypothetical protein